MKKAYHGALIAAAFAVATASASQAADRVKTGVVRTASGPVQGIVDGPLAKFLGIPYAAPPVGALRWQPPRDPQSWTQTLAAEKFGNACAQPGLGAFALPSNAEDCLYINVFAPKDLRSSSGGRPVMVWFYGGGYFAGASNDYDSSKLVTQGDVVVVTFNYRLGAFGFFSHPGLDREGHPFANYAIMDQQLALRWVKRNIAAFGGNPGNVTIFGQSAGAGSVIANLAAPGSAGLFQRAILQSSAGLPRPPAPPAALAKVSQDFAAAAGCPDQSAACLRSLPVATILAHQWPLVLMTVNNSLPIDGTVITKAAIDSLRTGQFQMPILAGMVRDEQAFFLPETNIVPVFPNAGKPLTASDYESFLASFGPMFTDKLRARYPLTSFPSPSVAQIEVSQKRGTCSARIAYETWSRRMPVYAYLFNDRTAPSYFPPLSYPMGAYHTSELQYLFPRFPTSVSTARPLNTAQSALSDRMVSLWTNFARTGVPSSDWAPYSPGKFNVMLLDQPAPRMIGNYAKDADCDIWDPIITASR